MQERRWKGEKVKMERKGGKGERERESRDIPVTVPTEAKSPDPFIILASHSTVPL